MQSSALARSERVVALLTAVALWSSRAGAAEPDGAPLRVEEPRRTLPAKTPRGAEGYQHWLGGVSLGKGLRFNNPYRLRRVLGDDGQSLSLSATYLDVYVGRTFSPPGGFEHGVLAQLSLATDGIRQEVFTPSYLLVRRLSPRVLAQGRAGVPIVLSPDVTFGLQAGLGAVYFFTASLGVGAQLDFSAFYGAATIERAVTVIPITSLALGVHFDWERLP